MLTATSWFRPRLLLALLPLLLIGGVALDRVLMTRHRDPAPHRFFSAFAAFQRAWCGDDHDSFLVGKLAHDAWDNPYLWECHGRRFTLVSAGPDGTYGTDDDIRSDR